MRNALILLVGLSLSSALVGGALSAPPQPGEITVADAASVTRLAVWHLIGGPEHHGSFSFDGVDSVSDPGFYSFQILGVWPPAKVNTLIGNFEVDEHTAEFWDVDSCKKVQFASLRKLQVKILQRANLNIWGHSRLPGFCDFSKFPKGLR